MRVFNIAVPYHADRRYLVPSDRRFEDCLRLSEKGA